MLRSALNASARQGRDYEVFLFIMHAEPATMLPHESAIVSKTFSYRKEDLW